MPKTATIQIALPSEAANYYRAYNRTIINRARRANIMAGWVFAIAVTVMVIGALLDSPFGCDAVIRLPLTDAVCVAIGR